MFRGRAEGEETEETEVGEVKGGGERTKLPTLAEADSGGPEIASNICAGYNFGVICK